MTFRLLCTLLLFSGCQNPAATNKVQKYFDSKSWIEGLITSLEAKPPLVEKNWMYAQRVEKKMVRKIDWQKELKLFLDADLNKSSFLMSYDSVKEDFRTVYRLKPEENLPIRELTVAFDSTRTPVRITCTRQSRNYFFSTGSEISLETHSGKLDQYEIRSVQRLLWFKPDTSFVSGKVVEKAK